LASQAGIGRAKMPLLTELENIFVRIFYKYTAPTVLRFAGKEAAHLHI
jgi:hypothetical protein